jgi:hypothetical protein
VKDLPRAARIMFKVIGSRTKKIDKNSVPLGWAAAAVFDFNGSIACDVNVSLFPDDNNVPINTTLSNVYDEDAMSLSAVLAADFTLADGPDVYLEHEDVRESMIDTRRPKSISNLLNKTLIVHSMPVRSTPIVAVPQNFTSFELSELTRILLLR